MKQSEVWTRLQESTPEQYLKSTKSLSPDSLILYVRKVSEPESLGATLILDVEKQVALTVWLRTHRIAGKGDGSTTKLGCRDIIYFTR